MRALTTVYAALGIPLVALIVQAFVRRAAADAVPQTRAPASVAYHP